MRRDEGRENHENDLRLGCDVAVPEPQDITDEKNDGVEQIKGVGDISKPFECFGRRALVLDVRV